MPKNRSKVKTASGAIEVRRPTSKLRIGPRKGGKSALVMTNEELQKVLDDASKKRYHAKAIAVLTARGATFTMPHKAHVDGLEELAEELRH